MSITFCIEAHSPTDDDALRSEDAPELNVHNSGCWTLLVVLGITPVHYGEIDAADLLARIDAAHERDSVRPPSCRFVPSHIERDHYLARNTARLRDVAVAANALGRQVVWGLTPPT